MVLAAVYGLFLLYVVLRLFRQPGENEIDYLVAGRRLSLPGFVASLVTTWYGGILGVGEYGWRYGLSNWLVFGVPYYLAAAIFAWLLAGRARRSRALTIPDQLEKHCGRPAALVGAFVVFVMTAPAAYVLMLGVLVEIATGWPLWAGVVVGTALSVGYVFRGGLHAIVLTDRVQFVLMFGGFLVLVPVCALRFGGWDWLQASLPAGHLTWDGGRGWQAIAVWYFIALATLVEPAFYQRCYAARSERTARTGILISLGFWVVFDFLTTTAGLYARALLPDLADPVAAFPALAAVALPPLWQGLFTVGLLATIMSTVDSYAFIAAVTLGRDLVQRGRSPRGVVLGTGTGHDSRADLAAARWGLLAVSVVAIALALVAESVVALWHGLGSIGTPVLLLPVLASHLGWRTRNRRAGRRLAAVMALAGAVALGWLLAGRGGGAWLGVEPIFPGLAVSLLGLHTLRRVATDGAG